ncbi:amino acid-binding protein [Methanobrevibacter olleyae]|uniref:ACT domain-containing protein n=1 Tax=Methanobrevibacter olleyae TaxID=294671 RepID=A0A126QYQ5_METOL|nr:amino acid-binding protein [Methanobrevibacter olleyae]AMK15280.1 allosteric regulator of homoserine dehydrogenase [Methanobrevibacter olleyae]SFL29264.1 ACT domain-containing protein [Methanobrevibacter olleyae]
MRMNLILEILDVPGQLVAVLNPIGELGANLVTIVHKREIKAEEGKVAVQIAIEGERENLKAVIDKFKEMGVSLVEVDDTVKKEKLSTILYGHIIDTDLRDTVDKINAIDGLCVSDLQLKLDGELKSTALLTIELDLGKREIAYNKVMEIAEEKDFVVIDEV